MLDVSENSYYNKQHGGTKKVRERELRRSMAVLPIGTVMKLTGLSARQIRYYEEQELIFPERNDGNRRMYSLNDIDVLFEISDLLSQGKNIAMIKRIFSNKNNRDTQTLSIAEVHLALEREFAQQGRFDRSDPTRFNQPRM